MDDNISFAISDGEGRLLVYGSGAEAFDAALTEFDRETYPNATLICGPNDGTGE